MSVSQKGSFCSSVEPFPMELLHENAKRINQLIGDINTVLDEVDCLEIDKKAFDTVLVDLEESTKRWSEKTDILQEKWRLVPQTENQVDEAVIKAAQENLEQSMQTIQKLKLLKTMETIFREDVPDPEATVEAMADVKELVAALINESK